MMYVWELNTLSRSVSLQEPKWHRHSPLGLIQNRPNLLPLTAVSTGTAPNVSPTPLLTAASVRSHSEWVMGVKDRRSDVEWVIRQRGSAQCPAVVRDKDKVAAISRAFPCADVHIPVKRGLGLELEFVVTTGWRSRWAEKSGSEC